MQSSPLGLQKWAVTLYLMTTGINGTSGTEIHRAREWRDARLERSPNHPHSATRSGTIACRNVPHRPARALWGALHPSALLRSQPGMGLLKNPASGRSARRIKLL